MAEGEIADGEIADGEIADGERNFQILVERAWAAVCEALDAAIVAGHAVVTVDEHPRPHALAAMSVALERAARTEHDARASILALAQEIYDRKSRPAC